MAPKRLVSAFLCLTILALAPSLVAQADPEVGTIWQQVTGDAGWSSRYRHGCAVFQNRLWVLGGLDGTPTFNAEVWSSTDGQNWTLATATPGWKPRACMGAVAFQDKLWVMGGFSYGPTARYNDIWCSDDGLNWSQVIPNGSSWGVREGPGVVVFQDKLWVMGGSPTGGVTDLLNDVWSSPDGVNWTQVTAAAPWPGRECFGAVVFQGRIWVFGGVGPSTDHSDVWWSENGVDWTQATAAAPWGGQDQVGRDDFAATVCNDRVWVLGGIERTLNASVFRMKNDVWSSTDGTTWTQSTDTAPWAARSGAGAAVFDGRIWLTGGAGTQVHPDVWCSPPQRNDGLVAWWKFDDGSGSAAADSSGNGHTGAVMGTATWVAGVHGGALRLDGTTSNYVQTAAFAGFPDTAITVSFWLRTTDTSRQGTPFSYAVSACDNEFAICHDYQGIDVTVHSQDFWAGLAPTDGLWHHIAATWRSSDGSQVLFKDGVQVAARTVLSGASILPGGTVILGQDQDSVGGDLQPSQSFEGLLDDVRIYNYARTPEQIAADATRVWYVKQDATGTGDGSSWTDAFPTLQPAIDAAFAADGGEVWVAAGTYKPTTNTSRTISFQLRSGVAAYGGFAGTESLRNQREWRVNATVLSGDIGSVGDKTDNCYHVVRAASAGGLVDGFTITGGYADGGVGTETGSGGGVYAPAGATISNCFVTANTGSTGGGLYGVDSAIEGCTITANSGRGGAGLCAIRCVVTNSAFAGNAAASSGGIGGGALVYSSEVLGCLFSGNSAAIGGGLTAGGCSAQYSSTVANCVFSGNTATDRGGAISSCSPSSFVNCTVDGNTAPKGGGLCAGQTITLQNVLFSGNTGHAVYETSAISPLIRSSLFHANLGGDYYDYDSSSTMTGAGAINSLIGSEANVDGNPRFTMSGTGAVIGTWTATPSYDAATNRTTLTDNSASFARGALVGRLIEADMSQRLQALVLANSATALEVLGDVTAHAASGDAYRLVDYRLMLGSAAIDAGTGTGAPATDIEGNPRYDDPGVANTGSGTPDYVDMGAYERQTASGEDGLLAWWRFDEGSGTTAVDSSGNGNTGTVNGNAAWTSGVRGDALSFDGVDDYVLVNNSAQLVFAGNQDFTIQAFVRSAGGGTILMKGDNILGGYYILRLGNEYASDGLPKGMVADTVADEVIGATSLNDDVWHCVTMVRRAGGTALDLHVDGVLQRSAPASPRALTRTDPLAIGVDLLNGVPQSPSSAIPWFNGLIDDVKLYNYARTPEQVAADADSDSDGLPDGWEITHFSTLDPRPSDDPDGDGYTNAQEYGASTDPTNASSFPHWYVKADATGAGDGSSWTDAFTTVQPAIDAAFAADGGEVWVAAGTYKPTTETDPAVSFRMCSDVHVYGGFAGVEARREQRDWVANATVLTGDIG